MNALSFKDVKLAIAKYCGKAGKCADDETVSLFAIEVMQQLLYMGEYGGLRTWEFITHNGMITMPQDMELPLKVKIDKTVENVMDKFYDFYSHTTLDHCVPFEKGLVEDPNKYFTQFDLPPCGAHIIALPYCEEAEDAHFIINGIDEYGKEVHYPHNGVMLKGEHLSITKKCPAYTQTKFKKITGIEKTETNHYVRLYWYRPETGEKGLLGEYRPKDIHPSFRRFRVLGGNCKEWYRVTILGRIRLFDSYSDNDIVPFSNIRAIKLMAQQLQSEDNNELDAAQYKNARIEQTLNSENNYKRTTSQTVDHVHVVSAGNIFNLI